MNNIDMINTRLDLMFNVLREKEGIEKGVICENIRPIDEYSILMNRRFKKENGIELTDLEKEIANEEGNFVRMYIAEEFYNLNLNNLNNIPFPQYDITMKELYGLLNTNQNKKYKVKM